jgi:hypothetical protein
MGLRRRISCALALALSSLACAPAGDGGGSGYTPPGTPAAESKVYAHSDAKLYTVDPETLQVTLVGDFVWTDEYPVDSMTDIAIDSQGRMVGISFDKVYAVNPATAVVTYLADLDRSFNGMSFISTNEMNGGGEVLVAAALDGSFYRLDPVTGQSTAIGNYGADMASSGDIVSVTGFGTVATVTKADSTTDWLVRVDPATGVASPIGDTGVSGIWGLGFWGTEIYGFTSANEFVLLDRDSGRASVVESSEVQWWGAGVTTEADVVD